MSTIFNMYTRFPIRDSVWKASFLYAFMKILYLYNKSRAFCLWRFKYYMRLKLNNNLIDASTLSKYIMYERTFGKKYYETLNILKYGFLECIWNVKTKDFEGHKFSSYLLIPKIKGTTPSRLGTLVWHVYHGENH